MTNPSNNEPTSGSDTISNESQEPELQNEDPQNQELQNQDPPAAAVPDEAGRPSRASSKLVTEVPSPVGVVGLGASAGGINVLQQFFSGMPGDSGLAFVVVIHLPPDYESTLDTILQARAAMPVIQVNTEVAIESNHVYVIPPGRHLTIEDGILRLTDFQQPPGQRVAIDLFFRTLAANYGQRAICVILSGTDSDGVIGLKHIKEQGGVTIAQDPVEAAYNGMPYAAIQTGMVDWILPVAQMPTRLMDLVRNEYRIQLPPEALPGSEESGEPTVGGPITVPQRPSETDEEALHEVLVFLRGQTGHDFSHYKRATVLRRVARRLQVNSLENVPSYLNFLRTHPAEAVALLHDLLISVTNFFRDKEAFKALEEHVPQLFAGKSENDHVRVWVAGCATGEEAYSIAILLAEHAAKLESPPSIQIFATDIDEDVIDSARGALYPATIEADVSAERLRRYFAKDLGGYRIRKEVRELVLFAPHNLLKDSPFSRLDLVTCRNLLIYLKREAQQRVFDTFHFALRPGGLLFLGGSENIDEDSALFAALDKRHRVFVRRALSRPGWQIPPLPIPSSSYGAPAHSTVRQRPFPLRGRAFATPPSDEGTENGGAEITSFTRQPNAVEMPFLHENLPGSLSSSVLAERRTMLFGELHLKMLEDYAPPSVVVNEHYDIVHLSERVGQFFRLTGGEPTANLLKLVPPALRIELRTALFRARQNGKSVTLSRLTVELQGNTRLVNIHLHPTTVMHGHQFILVIFEEIGEGGEAPVPIEPEPAVRQLEEELQQSKEQLTATVEQYEASLEELKASNEELQAMNEELRSTTEELETGKEELQSINEELTTVNQELKSNVGELERVNSDLQNLMASTEIGTIFLDRLLRIKRFTPRVQDIFNIIHSDIGRPLSDITRKLAYDALEDDAVEVLRSLNRIEREVRSDGSWYLVRLLPYRTVNDHIDGVVLTFIDITERRRAKTALRESQEQLSALMAQTTAGITRSDLNGKLTFINTAFCEMVGYSQAELEGKKIMDFIHPDDLVSFHVSFADLRSEGIPFQRELRFLRKDGSAMWANFNISPILDENNRPHSAAAAVIDVTAPRQEQAALQASEEQYRLLVEGTADYAMFLMDTERKIVHWNHGAERIFGFSRAEMINRSGDIIFTPEDRATGAPEAEAQTALRDGRAADVRWHVRQDGTRFWANGITTTLLDEAGHVRGFAKITRDATKERQAEEQLRQAHNELEARVAERTSELAQINDNLLDEVAQRQQAEQLREQLLQRLVSMQEEERRRISRELHDQMGQQLTALLMGLKTLPAAENLGETGALTDFGEQLQTLENITTNLAEQMHALAWQLRPPILDNFGIEKALRQHLEDWSHQSGVQSHLISRGLSPNSRFPSQLETAIYRVVQEALTNVQRHAKAQYVSVLLTSQDNSLAVTITDNGRGFDLQETGGMRLGILGMQERMELIGGTLTIESTPGEGTTVYARAPLPHENEDDLTER